MSQPGRSCPLRYRYRPDVFAAQVPLRAETLYVVGGLYGNVESLRRIFAMKSEEEAGTGTRVELLFNGDFNWFDCDAGSFREINEAVLRHPALTGNVEAELDSASDDDGCGCNYPDYVEAEVVERSNAIMRRLRARAEEFPEIRKRLAALPMHCSVEIGGQKIGVVHGDPESLSGWSFALAAMPPHAGRPHEEAQRPSSERIAQYFQQAEVCAFASTHTGTAFAQDFCVDGERRLVINNGAAGMPNFKDTRFGLLTRISSHLHKPADSVYGTTLGPTRFDAMPIHYDHAAWLKRFLINWPEGSPGHAAYFKRITEGPELTLQQACRLAH